LLRQTSFYPLANAYNYDDYKTTPETADEAYESVLAKVGTVNRDTVEKRIIKEVTNGTATYSASLGKAGFIDSPADADDWPTYDSGTAVTDADHDGMDDAWELEHGLDPTNSDDRNTVISNEGYTALEVYLCSLMGEKITITTGISDVKKDVNLKVYPNPVKDELNIESSKTVSKIRVFGYNGALVKSLACSNGQVNLSDLPSGKYLVSVIFNDSTRDNMKIIKE